MIVEHNENQSQTTVLWPKLARSEVRGTYVRLGHCASVPPVLPVGRWHPLAPPANIRRQATHQFIWRGT